MDSLGAIREFLNTKKDGKFLSDIEYPRPLTQRYDGSSGFDGWEELLRVYTSNPEMKSK